MSAPFQTFNPSAWNPRQTAASQMLGVASQGDNGSQSTTGLPFGLSAANAAQYGYTYSPAQQRWVRSDGSEAYGYGNQANQSTAYGLGGTTGMGGVGSPGTLPFGQSASATGGNQAAPPAAMPSSQGQSGLLTSTGGTNSFVPNVKQILDYYNSLRGGQKQQSQAADTNRSFGRPGDVWVGSDHPESNVWKDLPQMDITQPQVPMYESLKDRTGTPSSSGADDPVLKDILDREANRLQQDDLQSGDKIFTPGLSPAPAQQQSPFSGDWRALLDQMGQEQFGRGGYPQSDVDPGNSPTDWPSGAPPPTSWPEEQQSSVQAQVIGPTARSGSAQASPLDSNWLSYVTGGA